MEIGKLDKRIKIMQSDKVSDGSGGFENELKEVKTVWAHVRPISGREFWQAQQINAEISHKIIIRYTEAVNRTNLISYNGRIFDIQYLINVDEKNKWLEIQALEREH